MNRRGVILLAFVTASACRRPGLRATGDDATSPTGTAGPGLFERMPPIPADAISIGSFRTNAISLAMYLKANTTPPGVSR